MQQNIDLKLVGTFLNVQSTLSSVRMGGLSNFVYKVTAQGDESVIYRIYTNNFSIFMNRELETHLQRELSEYGLAPKILYADEIQRIEQYLPYNGVSVDQIKQDYQKIAHLLGQIHVCAQKDKIQSIYGLENQRIPSIKKHINNPNLEKTIKEVLNSQTFTSEEIKNSLINVFDRIFQSQVQDKLKSLFQDDSLNSLDLVLCHNDLNSTNFLQDDQGQYHLIDWETVGLNFPGYEIANFFNELTWDYSYNQTPFFKIVKQNGLNLQEEEDFLRIYWQSYTGQTLEFPQSLKDQIQICSITQNYYWLMIGALSLKFQKSELELDLNEYIRTRTLILEENLNIQNLWQQN